MSKKRKSRRKSRNRKSATSTESTQHNHALTGVSAISTTVASESKHDNDILNKQKSNLSDKQSARNEPSENKRKNVHVVGNDSSSKRKRNKRRRTTTEALEYQNDSKSLDHCTGKKAGSLHHRLI